MMFSKFANNKLKYERFKFKKVNRILFITVIIIYVFILAAYGYWDYSYRKNTIIKNIDKELYNSAVSLKYILPDDFHDRAKEGQSIPVSEDKYIALKLTDFVKETNFKYAYTIIKKEGNLFFITSDLVEDPQTRRGTFYYYPYEDADICFFEAFDRKEPTYRTVSDQWGTVRTVMIPEKSPGGVKYLSCVDYDISYVEGVLRKNLMRSITTLIFFLSISVPIIFIYFKLHSNYLHSLKKSEEKYRRIFEHSVVGFFQSTPEGRFVSVNTAFSAMLKYASPEELLSSITDIATQYYQNPFDRVRYQEILQLQGKVDGFEFKVKCKDGTNIWVSNSTRAYFDEKGQVTFYEGAVMDITERKTAEKALRQSEERYRSMVENTLDGFFVCDVPSVRFLFLNQRICDLFGYTVDEALELTIWDIIGPGQHSLVQRRIQDRIDGKSSSFAANVYTVLRKDGSTFQAEVSTSLTTYKGKSVIQGLLRDVTEKQRLQTQLQQVQKFEAIGTLAGGIAHDFNNILMGIQGRASLLSVEMDPAQPQMEHIEAIENYVKSATHLTRQLLGFARGGKYEVKPTDINSLLTDSIEMFGRTHKEIRIHMKLHESHPSVEVDKRQIEQVLLNVFVNAWQAMPDGGDLYIETSRIDLDETDRSTHRVEPGRFVKISITDTGIGMDKNTMHQIFDPFFTTKDKSRGTGLGLASAYGIISNHGGTITVHSEIDHGSTFNIYLPVSMKRAHREIPEKAALHKGSETILLVDDEEMIREVGSAMLENLGYRVCCAASGEEAVDTVRQMGETINLVILDMIMPGIGGGKTFDRIRALQPQLPVLLSSGYAINSQAEEIMQKGCNGFIQKPFSISVLSQKIRVIFTETQQSS